MMFSTPCITRTTIDSRGGVDHTEMLLCVAAIREGKSQIMISANECIRGLEQYQVTYLPVCGLRDKTNGDYLVPNGVEGDKLLLEWMEKLIVTYNLWNTSPSVAAPELANFLTQNNSRVYNPIQRIENLFPSAVYNAGHNVQEYRAANAPQITALQQQQAILQQQLQQQYLALQQQQQINNNGLRDNITATAQTFGHYGRLIEESQKQTAESQKQTAKLSQTQEEISNKMIAEFAASNKRHDISEQRLDASEQRHDGHDVELHILKDRVHQLELNSPTPKKASAKPNGETPKKASAKLNGGTPKKASSKPNGGTPPVAQTVTEDDDE